MTNKKKIEDEVPTPGGVRTYWATDFGLAVEVTEEDWEDFEEEMRKGINENYKDSRKEKLDGNQV